MRISDWSSDVCSSDLGRVAGDSGRARRRARQGIDNISVARCAVMSEWLYFALIFGGMLMGMQGERWRAAWARREWKSKRAQRRKAEAPLPFRGEVRPLPAFDAAEQLRCVMAARFEKRPLLNKSEARVLLAAARAAQEVGHGWRVMA